MFSNVHLYTRNLYYVRVRVYVRVTFGCGYCQFLLSCIAFNIHNKVNWQFFNESA